MLKNILGYWIGNTGRWQLENYLKLHLLAFIYLYLFKHEILLCDCQLLYKFHLYELNPYKIPIN